MHLRSRRFRAVIFDMDGVLTDSEPAFHAAINDILARYGKHVAHRGLRPVHRHGDARHVDEDDRHAGAVRAARRHHRGVRARADGSACASRAPPSPARANWSIRLRDRGVPIALCTASYRRWVDAILPSAGLDGLFDVLSTCEMVTKTKPQPEPYLLAAEKLGVPPELCVAIEDSTNGLTSALGAGMHVIQLRATGTAAPPMPGVARIISFPARLPARSRRRA